MGEWKQVHLATCTERGSEERKCAACDYSEMRFTNATGHTEGEWVTDVEPTYEHIGYKHRECGACGTILENGTVDVLEKQGCGAGIGSTAIVPIVMLAALMLKKKKED